MSRLGAVILAAGLSSRMGEFKPLLEVGKETMISRVVSMMECASTEPIAIVTGYMYEQLEISLKSRKIQFIYNERFRETQMLDSLILGLDVIENKCERLLVSPADVPLVLPETVDELLRLDAQFARPVYKGAPGHPVLLRTEIIPLIRNYKGEGGLRGAVESEGIEIKELETDDCGVVLDADTKEGYRRLLEVFNARSGVRG